MNRPFSPTAGVGVIGLCWERNQEVAVDVEKLASALNTEQDFLQYRQQHGGGDSVMNLTWADFKRVQHRGAVFACPIRNGRNKFVGCLSFDATHGFAIFDQEELKNQMSLLSLVIGQADFENT